MKLADPCRVWVRSLGNACRIRVQSMDNARWLLDRLSQTPALAGLTFVDLQRRGAVCTFQVPNSDDRTLVSLEDALERIPGVQLMLEPEPVSSATTFSL